MRIYSIFIFRTVVRKRNTEYIHESNSETSDQLLTILPIPHETVPNDLENERVDIGWLRFLQKTHQFRT